MIFGHVYRSGRRLTQKPRLKVHMITDPSIVQHDKPVTHMRMHIAQARLQATPGLRFAEPVGNGDDNGLAHSCFAASF